jgi:diguanylate cyclase (GGDEF)-like protein
MQLLRRIADGIRRRLPRGGDLPQAEFERRHRSMLALLWLSGAALPIYGLARGHGALDLVSDALVPFFFAAVATPRSISPRARSIAATLGLSSSAAMGVDLSGGVIEAHFSFFVLVVLLTLYEDWVVFGLAVAFTLLHHGILGTFEPGVVFAGKSHARHPWTWATIHAVYVAAAGAAAVLTWRLNEDVRGRMRSAQADLERAAATDSLTGLANRRQLVADLERAAGRADDQGESSVLVLADLDGFKPYNDTFGHLAGDALLQQLGNRLADAMAPWGTAYRLGGDEFCVLARGGEEVRTAVTAAAQSALSARGEGFVVTSSTGTARMPEEATTVGEALRIADQRMYLHKSGGRPSTERQTKAALLRALAERHPDLGHNLDDVAELAVLVATRLGLAHEEIERVRHAAELHDVGKVSIPDTILLKAGPLDEEEWVFMRRHTVIGERIVGAAPALAAVAQIVRSTHERWDGAGYPDGLADETIPLAARIVAVCDAYDAMVSDRPYRKAWSAEQALAELKRCAGSQFDPAVVEAFAAAVAPQAKAA